MEVAQGIHRLETPFGERVNAVYLLAGTRASLLVDTATRDTAGHYLDRVRQAAPLRYVLNTHSDWDHTAGNGVVAEAFPDASLLAHELDRPMIEDVEALIARRYGEFAGPHGHDETAEAKDAVRAATATTSVHIGLTGGETIDLGDGWRVTVLHTPGHSWGSVSVFDPRANAVIVGDAVLGDAVPTAAGAPAFPPTYRYLDTYLATIGLLTQLAPSVLLTGHYPVYRDDQVAEFLHGSRAFTDRVDRAVRRHLREAGEPVSMAGLVGALGASLGRWPREADPALHFPLSGHLERLAATGQVRVGAGDDGRVRYTWLGEP